MSSSQRPPGLLEVAPGDGWLARERDRLVWIPHSLDPDSAYSFIEPLLIAASFEAATRTVEEWPGPLLRFVLMQLTSPVRMVSAGFGTLRRGGRFDLEHTEVGPPSSESVMAVPSTVRQIRMPGPTEPSSGMLVHGVVRAGAWRWHVVRTPTPRIKSATSWLLDGSFGRVALTENLQIGRTDDPAHSTQFVGLADPTVSRSHAVLLVDNQGPTIVDARSRNGTWVVPRSATTPVAVHDQIPYRLADGDAVVIGQSWFVCHRLD